MQLDFKIDFDHVTRGMLVEAPRQLPFAMARTLTKLASDAQKSLVREMPVVFDRPTRFTLDAVSIAMATKTSQQAKVFFKQSEASAGRSKNEHIRPGAEGAYARAQKKTEYLLTRLGDLPPGWVTVPGKSMPLDGYGNLAGSYYKQIVNVLQLKVNTSSKVVKGVSKASQKRGARMGVASEMFAVAPGKNAMSKGGGWLPPGVYKHLPNRQLLQMLKFVRKAGYTKRLDVLEVVRATVTKQVQIRWRESVDWSQALAVPIKGKR